MEPCKEMPLTRTPEQVSACQGNCWVNELPQCSGQWRQLGVCASDAVSGHWCALSFSTKRKTGRKETGRAEWGTGRKATQRAICPWVGDQLRSLLWTVHGPVSWDEHMATSLLLFTLTCMYHVKACVEVRGQPAGVSSLFPHWGSMGQTQVISIFIYSLSHLSGPYIYIFYKKISTFVYILKLGL